MKQIGPTRLILLNCGKFDYAEIDLDRPLHLVGPNNIGKTSLIAVLQYLYLDNQNKMRFSRDVLTTRKYYFPDVSSFALFESLGPEGFQLTGIHGLGPIKQYEIERFSYQGRFDRSDYLSASDCILSWDEIKTNLASKNYSALKAADLRAALMGNEGRKRRNETNAVNLSLVPLRRKDEYDRFCSVFLNLLRLSHLRQDELKELLLQLSDREFTKRRIDLQEQFAPQLDQLKRQKTDVDDLKRNEPAIRRILKNVDRRDYLRGVLNSLYAHIGKEFMDLKSRLDDQCRMIEVRLQEYLQMAAQNKVETGELEQQKDEKTREKGAFQQKRDDLERLEERFGQFNLEWTHAHIIELEANIRNIESNLDMAKNEPPESIRRRLFRSESEYKKLKEQLENVDSAFITSLMQDLNEQQVDKLSRIFNDDILGFSTFGQDAPAKIKDRKTLIQYLNRMLAGFSENTYVNDAITLDLNNVRHFDINEYTDPERIRENMLYHVRNISKTKEALHAAENQQELRTKCDALKEKRNAIQDQCAQFRNYLTLRAENADLPKKLKAIDTELSTLQSQLNAAYKEQKQIEQKQTELSKEKETLQNQFEQMSHRVSRLDRPEEDWKMVEYETGKGRLSDMLDSYSDFSNEHLSLANIIADELEIIHTQTYDRYQAATEKESLDMLRNELDTLDEKQKALEESWASFTVQLKKDFRELNRDMDKLLAKVIGLNTALAKVHISNLANLKINVSVRTQWKGYFSQVEESEDAPLFTDSAKTDEVIRKIGKLLQEKPVISLEDMFDMHFEITTPSGEVKKYDHLDRIESNGTTIAIKVLINLILLKGLLSDERVYVPFYLDECSSLDSENLRSIVEQARLQGFIAILASPEAMDAADNIYYLSENKGRVTLNPQNSLLEIVRDKKGEDYE